MEEVGREKTSWYARALWGGAVCVASLVVLLAFLEAWNLPFSRQATLVLSGVVAVLVGQYRARIPRTHLVFPTANLFAFWGTIWIGVPGGVLLGGLAAIAGIGSWRRAELRRAASAAGFVVAAFFSAAAFYIAQGQIGTLEPVMIGALAIPQNVVAASIAMALTHYAQIAALSYLSSLLTAEPAEDPFRTLLVNPAITHTLALIATIGLYVTFSHFGIEFGFVVLFAAVIGNLVYRIYSRVLAVKTRQLSEASRMHLATVEALAMAIDARDQIGVGHVRRTQIYAVGIGELLGLPEGEINALRTGALLHDIGKLGIPDHILNKPGRLSNAEMEKMKTHAEIGAAILAEIGFPYDVVPMVKHHHERWNGTGYPDQLQGKEIPVTARVLRIADSYDTMRGARHYRPAVTADEAYKMMRAGAGKEFDPHIVDLFLQHRHIFEEEIDFLGLSYDDDVSAPRAIHDLRGEGAPPNFIEQIQNANLEVFTLYSLARDFTTALTMSETLSLFTQNVDTIVPYDTCLIYLLDESKEFATAVHVDGVNAGGLKGRRVNVGEGATGYVLKKGKAVENVDPALDFAFSQEELSGEYIAMASVPMLAGDAVIGAVTIYSRQLPAYADEHIRLLETVTKIATDAVARTQHHAEIRNHAFTDPMTGLPNARSLQMQFEKEVKRSNRNGSAFQLLMLDLDGFKDVNDNYGHPTGDAMLKAVTGVIRDQLREYDFLARYGGDEFVAIVPDTQSADVLELCQRIEAAVTDFRLVVGEDRTASVGVSIGAACHPHQGESFDQIVNAADAAMYKNKEFHRKRDSRREELSQSGQFPAVTDAAVPTNALGLDENDLGKFAVISTSEGEGMIVEVDEAHITASAAVN